MGKIEIAGGGPAGAAPSSVVPRRAGHAIFKYGFVPSLLVVTLATWLHRSGAERWLKASRMGLDFTSAALLASIMGIWLAEQLYPADADQNYNLSSNAVRAISRFGRDLFYLSFVTLGSALLVGLTASHLASAFLSMGLGFGLTSRFWPVAAPFPLKVALAFLLVELLSYWMHRAAHRFQFLWRFHGTHHVITEMTGIKAIRTHPIDNVFFYLARNAPLMMLGAGVPEILAVTYLGSILGILAHANICVSDGVLGWVVNFPQYHSVHHSSVVAESNSNFGCHTVVWDRIFGTFSASPAGTLVIGVLPVGPRSLWQELVAPAPTGPDPK